MGIEIANSMSRLEALLRKTQWYDVLSSEYEKPYFKYLNVQLSSFINAGNIIFPEEEKIFEALKITAPDDTKIVILGQDPYHGPGQANGLAFSVNQGVKLPPSLVNIIKELKTDVGCLNDKNIDLKDWAAQGVLLLNTSLTVNAHQAGSHAALGWQFFTDAIISILSNDYKKKIFMLWGTHAQSKMKLINPTYHAIISTSHPSPLSVRRGFEGSKPFSTANNYLTSWGMKPIKWC